MSSNILIPLQGGASISAERHSPATGTAKALIVIAYGSDGLTDDLNGPWATMIRGYASALADLGFDVVIPDYLDATHTPPGAAALEMIAIHREDWIQSICATIDHVSGLTKGTPPSIGLLGFSRGGHLALRLRAKALVLESFFAPMLDGIGASGSLTHAQIHHGLSDKVPGTGPENAGLIASVLNGEGTETEVFTYPGAGHGFIGTDRANSNARDQSRKRTLVCFQAHL